METSHTPLYRWPNCLTDQIRLGYISRLSLIHIYLPINTVWTFEGFLRVMDSEMSF